MLVLHTSETTVKQAIAGQLQISACSQYRLFARYTDNQLGHVNDTAKVIVPGVRQRGTVDKDIKIQTQKGSNKRLFILIQTHSMQIVEEIPFIKSQNDT